MKVKRNVNPVVEKIPCYRVQKKESYQKKRAFSFIMLFMLALLLQSGYAIGPNHVHQGKKISDDEITTAVSLELIVQGGIPAKAIDVKTERGIVTLSGEVANILAKDRAVEISSMIKGVRGIINKIKVKDSGRNDDAVEKDIKESIALNPATELYKLRVKVHKGVAELAGEVDSWQEKQLAERTVKGVAGVKDVQNKIDVNFVDDRGDAEIKNEIQKTLQWDAKVDDGLIDATVDHGIVKLSGIVGSAIELNIAKTDAWVAGVKSVDDENLKVERWSRDDDLQVNKLRKVSDSEIMEAVKNTFNYDPRVSLTDPSITINEGEVSLVGIANSLMAKRAAEMDAKNVVGVSEVHNYLQVRSNQPVPDSIVLKNVRSVIKFNPNVNKYEVGIAVSKGEVYLRGMVDSNYEKYQAEKSAASVKGVQGIHNDLTVERSIPYVYDFEYGFYQPMPVINKTPTKKDLQIKEDIEKQFWWSPFVNKDDVEVSVKGGIAILKGTVGSWKEYYSAEKNAYDGGAIKVRNNLIVKSS